MACWPDCGNGDFWDWSNNRHIKCAHVMTTVLLMISVIAILFLLHSHCINMFVAELKTIPHKKIQRYSHELFPKFIPFVYSQHMTSPFYHHDPHVVLLGFFSFSASLVWRSEAAVAQTSRSLTFGVGWPSPDAPRFGFRRWEYHRGFPARHGGTPKTLDGFLYNG